MPPPAMGVKRAWFLRKDAHARFPRLSSMQGATIVDAASGKHMRVRIAGRAVTIETAAHDAAPDGTLDPHDVPERYRVASRRVSISTEPPTDIFNPLVPIAVASACVFDSGSEKVDDKVDDVRTATAALFRKCTVVAGAAPTMFVPLACVTFETLLDQTSDVAALTTLGAQYLRMLKMCVASSPHAREVYSARCFGLSTAQLRAELLATTRNAMS
jgi:hypothetical protein